MKHYMSLTAEEKSRRSYILAVVSFLIAAVWFIILLYLDVKYEQNAKLCTEQTQGTVSAFHDSRYSIPNYITAMFTVDGTTYFTKGLYEPSHFSIKDRLGNPPVTVYYEPDNPENAYADEPYAISIVWYIIALLFIPFGALFIMQGRNPKRIGKYFKTSKDGNIVNVKTRFRF